jgi:hypothetical protein
LPWPGRCFAEAVVLEWKTKQTQMCENWSNPSTVAACQGALAQPDAIRGQGAGICQLARAELAAQGAAS